MKIAFLGKGGSGKSTLSVAFARHAVAQGMSVLAIDADHNMDMTYGLGVESPTRFLGSDTGLIKRHVGVPENMSFRDASIAAEQSGVRFSIFPHDAFTQAVSTQVSENLTVMTAGPHTDIVRSGEHCSHSLAAPLKVYLPLLKLRSSQVVVIDERAGTDPVATGILKGVDIAFIVIEPTVQSVRVGKQISEELTRAEIRHEFVLNKYQGSDDLASAIPRAPVLCVAFTHTESSISSDMQKLSEAAV